MKPLKIVGLEHSRKTNFHDIKKNLKLHYVSWRGRENIIDFREIGIENNDLLYPIVTFNTWEDFLKFRKWINKIKKND